jgi:hypothetical protein
MHFFLKVFFMRWFSLIFLLMMIGFTWIWVTDITFLENIFGIDIIHLVLMCCNYFDFIRIFSLSTVFILFKLYSDWFWMTIRFSIKIIILGINTIVKVFAFTHFGFIINVKPIDKYWRLSISKLFLIFVIVFPIIGIPLCMWISSLFFFSIVHICILGLTIHIGII